MSDENEEYFHHHFGRKINKEKRGYTVVDKDDGIARPVLKIPSDIPKGKRRLTAVYTDDKKKVYAPSLARAIVYNGYKCYVHCPTIYQPKNLKTLTLKANLFYHNRPVDRGNGKFKIEKKYVSPNPLAVTDGHVEESFKKTVESGTKYQFAYWGNIGYNISPDEGEGRIITYTEGRTPLIVDVMRVIVNKNEETRLIARVYHRNRSHNYIKYPDDIPKSGTIKFYIDGRRKGAEIKINSNGFVSVIYTATDTVGVHDLTAVYTPDTPEMEAIYQQTSGANTLFIGNDHNRPILTAKHKSCGKKGDKVVFSYTANKNMTGKLRLYIDGISIQTPETEANGTYILLGNKGTLYEQDVNKVTSFNFTVTVPDFNIENIKNSWGYGGKHNVILQYIYPDTDKKGDMEYWYVMSDFLIQSTVGVALEYGIDDMDNTSDDGTYSGNNLYLLNSNNKVEHYVDTILPTSVVIGNKIKVKATTTDTGEPVTAGKVRIIAKSRKKERWTE